MAPFRMPVIPLGGGGHHHHRRRRLPVGPFSDDTVAVLYASTFGFPEVRSHCISGPTTTSLCLSLWVCTDVCITDINEQTCSLQLSDSVS